MTPEEKRAANRQANKRYKERHPDRVAASRAKQNDKMRGVKRVRKPEDRHRFHIKHRYGITQADYDALLESQDGGCAICEEPPVVGKNLSVDHSHRANTLRGLLCRNCNTALGLVGDRTMILRRMIAYLEVHDKIRLKLIG